MPLKVLRIDSNAPANYIAAVRRLQLRINQAGGNHLNVANVISDGPERTLDHIDVACGFHSISQTEVEEVCTLYDKLMQDISDELANEAAA